MANLSHVILRAVIYLTFSWIGLTMAQDGKILCSEVNCDDSFFNTVKSVMTVSCNQCFSLNYSVCTSLRRSPNFTTFTFCDHNLPLKCSVNESSIENHMWAQNNHSSFVCQKNISLSETPKLMLRDVNRHNFTVVVPNLSNRDYWSRLRILEIKLRLFCPEAVCSKSFDRLTNDTFLLKEIDLPMLPSSTPYSNLTLNWTDVGGYAADSSANFAEALSIDYSFSYNKSLLVESDNIILNKTLTPVHTVFHVHSEPIVVRYTTENKTSFNVGLIVLGIFIFVLLSGMLLAALARKHASQSLTNRYKRKSTSVAQDESTLVSSFRFEKQNTRFEEEYKLLPMPTKIGPPSTNLNAESSAENNNNENVPSSNKAARMAPNSLKAPAKYEDIWQTSSIVIPFNDLDLLEIIGQGRFGPIKRGYVGQKNECMVHCAKAPYAISAEESKTFLEHLDSSIKARSHPNVISFIGVCGQGEDLYIAMQLENGQNLRNLLRESRTLDNFTQFARSRGRISLMSPQRLLSIMLGVARGMGYLEENKVLHDSLAAVNIIIGENGTPKVGGFGMATMSDLYKRQLDKDHKAIRWMPPETLTDHLFSLKSQVWSFGVVIWEIITLGGLPYNRLDERQVLDQVPHGHRLNRPSNCGPKLYELLVNKLWLADAESRPNFGDILRHLHDLNLNPEEHINLNLVEEFAYEAVKHEPPALN